MKILIGKVVKAQGIKGEVKLECYIDSPKLIKDVKIFYINDIPYTVTHTRADGNFLYVKFRNVDDRNTAEVLKGTDVYSEKNDIEVPSGSYFLGDIIGCGVFTAEGVFLGTVKDVLQYGAADVYELTGVRPVAFPWLKKTVVSVNTDAKKIVVDGKIFSETAVYDDDEV